jgi:hypothetical protein
MDRAKLDLSEPNRVEPNEGLHRNTMLGLRYSEILHSVEW